MQLVPLPSPPPPSPHDPPSSHEPPHALPPPPPRLSFVGFSASVMVAFTYRLCPQVAGVRHQVALASKLRLPANNIQRNTPVKMFLFVSRRVHQM